MAAESQPPRANRLLLALAFVMLATPVVALLWVSSYARVEPRLAGFPFFIWYQFLWVFLCSALTVGAYFVVRMARRRPAPHSDDRDDLVGGGRR